MSEYKAGDEWHAVSEIQTHDGEDEDAIYSDGFYEHEKSFGKRADGDESDGAGGRFAGWKDA